MAIVKEYHYSDLSISQPQEGATANISISPATSCVLFVFINQDDSMLYENKFYFKTNDNDKIYLGKTGMYESEYYITNDGSIYFINEGQNDLPHSLIIDIIT